MELIKKLDIRFKSGKMRRFGLFLCPCCNKESERVIDDGKKSKTCGCKMHGMRRTRLYKVWADMVQRCTNKNSMHYKYYGGRGIDVCEEWRVPKNFIEWALVNGYSDDLEIDRINNDGDYTPDNCRFTTRTENARNSRATKLTLEKVAEIRKEYGTGLITQKGLAEEYGVRQNTIERIVNYKIWR